MFLWLLSNHGKCFLRSSSLPGRAVLGDLEHGCEIPAPNVICVVYERHATMKNGLKYYTLSSMCHFCSVSPCDLCVQPHSICHSLWVLYLAHQSFKVMHNNFQVFIWSSYTKLPSRSWSENNVLTNSAVCKPSLCQCLTILDYLSLTYRQRSREGQPYSINEHLPFKKY